MDGTALERVSTAATTLTKATTTLTKATTTGSKASTTQRTKATALIKSVSPRSHGLVFRAVAREARGPGFDPSSDQMFFHSSGTRR